jgi:hypothetical protein
MGVVRHRHEHFETRRTLVDPRRACPRSSLSRLGSAEPEASCSSHRAADEASHLHDVRPRTGRAAPVGWLLVHRIQAVVVEAKGLPEGEPTAVRYNSSGLSSGEAHSFPSSDRDPLTVLVSAPRLSYGRLSIIEAATLKPA